MLDTREYFTPKTNLEQIVKDKHGKITMYLFTNSLGKACMRAFIGKRTRPTQNVYFNSPKARDEYARQWFTNAARNYAAHEERKAAERKERTEGAKRGAELIQVGDLFCSTTSYNMTINAFYQVVQKSGKNLVVVRADSHKTGDGWTGDEYARAVPASEIPERKHYSAKITGEARISVEGDYSATKTTEAERHYYNSLD